MDRILRVLLWRLAYGLLRSSSMDFDVYEKQKMTKDTKKRPRCKEWKYIHTHTHTHKYDSRKHVGHNVRMKDFNFENIHNPRIKWTPDNYIDALHDFDKNSGAAWTKNEQNNHMKFAKPFTKETKDQTMFIYMDRNWKRTNYAWMTCLVKKRGGWNVYLNCLLFLHFYKNKWNILPPFFGDTLTQMHFMKMIWIGII